MKTLKIFLILLGFGFMQLNSQTNLNATLNSFKRATPLIGFNGNAGFSATTWAAQSWLDSVATLNSAIFRFPGGSNANYFDWQTGASMNSACTPTWVANMQNTIAVKAEDWKVGMNACAAKAVIVINFQCSNVTYQIQGLNYAASKGIPIERIEMGNEHNLSFSPQYIPAGIYSKTGKIWADSLKAHYPNAKICMVGGAAPGSPLTIGWLDSIFAQGPNIDAVSFHLYLGAGNTDNQFCTKRALSIPFNINQGVNYRFSTSQFTNTVVPSNIEVWATEFNLGEQLAGGPMQHAGTWTHALYISEMSHLLMRQPKVTMLLDHDVTGAKDFAAVDYSLRVTASGAAMQLLGEMSKGTDSTQLIDFTGQSNINWSTTAYPSLIGWKFWKGNNQYGWVTNLSSSPIKVSFNQIIGGSIKYDNYYADTTFFVSSIKSINHISGNTADSVTLPPFSITTLLSLSNTAIKNLMSNEQGFSVYPNPANNILSFSETLFDFEVYNIVGQKVISKIKSANNVSIQELGEGVYFIRTGSTTIKFVVKH